MESIKISENATTLTVCSISFKFYTAYIQPIFDITGLILNIINAIILIHLIRCSKHEGSEEGHHHHHKEQQNGGKMHKFLLTESILKAYYSLFNFLSHLYHHFNYMRRHLTLAYVDWIMVVYGCDVAMWMALLCKFCVSCIRLKKIKTLDEDREDDRHLHHHKNKSFLLIITGIFLFSAIIYSYRFLHGKIQSYNVIVENLPMNIYGLNFDSLTNFVIDIIVSGLIKFMLIVAILIVSIVIIIMTKQYLDSKSLTVPTDVVIPIGEGYFKITIKI